MNNLQASSQCRLHFKRMLNKLKKPFYADDFSYFIRYFLRFSLPGHDVTIIQVMRSSLTRPLMIISKAISFNKNPASGQLQDDAGRQYPEPENKDSEHEQAPDIKIEEPGQVSNVVPIPLILWNDDYQNVSAKIAFELMRLNLINVFLIRLGKYNSIAMYQVVFE